MAAQEMLKSIADKVGTAATVNTVFGEPQVLHNRAIIPVAMVIGGFGGGGGECNMPGPDTDEPHATGGGGGGGFAARPLAFLEVSDEGTKLIPIMDLTKIVLACIGLVGGTLIVVTKLTRKKK